MLEAVVLEGRGVTPQLTVEGREPGTDLPILFEYTEKMLSSCESSECATPVHSVYVPWHRSLWIQTKCTN